MQLVSTTAPTVKMSGNHVDQGGPLLQTQPIVFILHFPSVAWRLSGHRIRKGHMYYDICKLQIVYPLHSLNTMC